MLSQLLIYQRVRLCANLFWSDLGTQVFSPRKISRKILVGCVTRLTVHGRQVDDQIDMCW
jgi:hypothetical protein